MAVEPVQGPLGLLAGLVQGYVGGKNELAQDELSTRVSQRDHMLAYMHEMISNPDVPPEHKQWAMEQAGQLAQHDITKKFPKGLGDLSTLPAVNLKQPPRQAVSQTPGMTLQPPVGPGAAPNTSSEVGRAANGTVNALGASKPEIGPPAAAMLPPVGPDMSIGQRPLTLPPGAPVAVQNPQQAQLIAPAGAPHVLTPSEHLQYANAAEQEQINRLQQQYPGKSPEELAYMARNGEFPKPQLHSLSPGQELVDEHGNIIAKSSEQKPLPEGKVEAEPAISEGRVIGIRDNRASRIITDRTKMSPDQRAIYDTALTEQTQKRQQQLEDERARFTQQFNMLNARDQEKQQQEARADIRKTQTAHDVDSDRLKIMEQNEEAALKGDQQAMVSLLTNHIGMTLGLQKGARITRAMYDEAQQSAPWLQRVSAKFDGRGYLTGVVLSPEQMTQMVELAKNKEAGSSDRLEEMQNRYSDLFPQGKGASKGLLKPPVGGGTKPQPTDPGKFNWNDHPIAPSP